MSVWFNFLISFPNHNFSFNKAVKIFKNLSNNNNPRIQLGQPVKFALNNNKVSLPSLRIALGSFYFIDNSGMLKKNLVSLIRKDISIILRSINNHINKV